jgi:hypothetical protein
MSWIKAIYNNESIFNFCNKKSLEVLKSSKKYKNLINLAHLRKKFLQFLKLLYLFLKNNENDNNLRKKVSEQLEAILNKNEYFDVGFVLLIRK